LSSDKLHTAKQLSERLLEYPETDWDHLINDWCAGDEKLHNEVQRLADLNRNARNFVEEFQKRVYKLTKSSLDSGVDEPSEIGGYKQIRRLGSGGSATVYLVQNESGKKGALKMLLRMTADEHSHQRFEAERHILATLNHPNIARLIEGGITSGGDPYVIMEYVDGIPVDKWCDRNLPGIPERIRLFQKICRAVHYAHQNLVVHRDIKPEHVLIDANGGVKLIDFGIAKLLQPDNPELAAIHTRTGMRVMTPDFASPEQVRGERITTASDVYSLGVLLYLLLTGHRPYKVSTTSMLEIERIICETAPQSQVKLLLNQMLHHQIIPRSKRLNQMKKPGFAQWNRPDLPGN
jgi:eukaryotic-like serine/threonine-protein kinase